MYIGRERRTLRSGLDCSASSFAILEDTIISHSATGTAVTCDGTSTATLSCCDVYGNAGGDWVGCIADQAVINGNFSADPLYCDPDAGDFTLQLDSPCAPPGVTGCELVGALPVGCGTTSIDEDTWTRIKGRYRSGGR